MTEINNESTNDDWKKALIHILNKRLIEVDHDPFAQATFQGADHKSEHCRLTSFFKSYNSIERVMKNNVQLDNASLNPFISANTHFMLKQLLDFKLLKMTDRNPDGKAIIGGRYALTLSEKGLDVALKLQEHDDNERRFKQQSDISEVLKGNSSKSIVTAWVALVVSIALVGLSIYRVHQLERKIESHTTIETRINSLDAEVKELKKKMNI
jgi:hypothetical protein